MKRRSFTQSLLALPAAPALLGQEIPKIDFSVPDAGAEPVPHFFTAPQLAAVRRLSDLILPSINGTPGALEARAPEFLDFLLGQSPADRKALYRNGLDALNATARRQYAKGFADLDATQADAPVAGWYWPAAQRGQKAADAPESLPTAQLEQLADADAPVVARYLPAAQLLQLVAPVAAWYLPTEQAVHVVAEAKAYDPAAHAVPAVTAATQ